VSQSIVAVTEARGQFGNPEEQEERERPELVAVTRRLVKTATEDSSGVCNKNKKQTPRSESASKLYRPSDRRLLAKLVPTFADKGCHMISVTSLRPYSRFSRSEPLLFLPSSSSIVFNCTPDQLLLRKSGSAGNRTRASGSAARNSDH
jgi:hypothetical protein